MILFIPIFPKRKRVSPADEISYSATLFSGFPVILFFYFLFCLSGLFFENNALNSAFTRSGFLNGAEISLYTRNTGRSRGCFLRTG